MPISKQIEKASENVVKAKRHFVEVPRSDLAPFLVTKSPMGQLTGRIV
jgi:hypothetical protein